MTEAEKVGGLKLSHWLIFQVTALGLLMAVSGMGANLNGAALLEENNKDASSTVPVVQSLTVKEYINKYFSDIPVMIEVARCESQFRQHGKSGEVLTGLVNEFDKGVMQINEYYHKDDAEKLGYDIHTLEGNVAYARFLFETQGLQPWISSSKCWKNTKAYGDYRTELALKTSTK